MPAERDIGAPVDWTPAAAPVRTVLEGRYVRVEPLDERHRAELFRNLDPAAGDAALWDYLPYGPFDEAGYADWLAWAAASEDPLFVALVDRERGEALGQASYLRIEPALGSIEIGHIALGPALQRTPAATEALYLMARHSFDDLGYRRLEWKTDALNARSRRAAERLGFTFEGIFRQHLVVKGRNRDTAWFSIIDGEWPAIRASFEEWLEPGNFEADGRQRRTLEDIRASLA